MTSDPALLKSLLAQLSSDSSLAQRYAIDLLGNLREPRAVNGLIAALASDNALVRVRAAAALIKISRPAIPALVNALHDRRENVWTVAAAVLSRIGRPAVRPLMVALTEGQDPAFCILTIGILGQIADPDSAGVLAAQLGSDNENIRTATAVALARLGEPAVSVLLQVMVEHIGTPMSRYAVEIFKRIGEDAVPRLLDIMHDGNELERSRAAYALGEIGESALPLLVRALDHEDAQVRYSAAMALGHTRSPLAVRPLVRSLTDTARSRHSGLRVCDVSLRALERIGTPDALGAVRTWKDSLVMR